MNRFGLFLFLLLLTSSSYVFMQGVDDQFLTGGTLYEETIPEISLSGDVGEQRIIQTTTGSTLYETPVLEIRIEELFPKDTPLYGEYILLSFSTPFQGEVRIVGLGTSSSEKIVTIQTSYGEQIILTDSPQKFVAQRGQKIVPVSSITLTDTGEPLEVWVGDVLYDHIIYTQSSTSEALGCTQETNTQNQRVCNHYKTPSVVSSFTQTSSGSTTTGTTTSGSSTTTSGSNDIGNTSGGTSLGSGSILSGETTTGSGTFSGSTEGGITSGSTTSGDNFFGSGYVGSGENIAHTGQNGLSGVTQNTYFQIEEIYPYDDLFPEYIELLALTSYSGELLVGGLGQGKATKSVFLQTQPGIRRIVTDDTTAFHGYPFVVGVASISLTNDGEELALLLPHGQQIDTVVYSGLQEGMSALFSEHLAITSGSVRGFFSSHPPTPGYTYEMVAHHVSSPTNDSQLPVCGIHRQHTTPVLSSNKVNLQATINGTMVQNSTTTYTCERVFPGGENIAFTGCNPSYLSFAPGIHPLVLRVKKNTTTFCEVYQELNLPAPPDATTKTTTSPSTYYEELYRKRKEKYEQIVKQIRSLGFTVNSSNELGGEQKQTDIKFPQELLVSGGGPPVFRIHSVLPNPVGKDTLGEHMVLENISTGTILSDDLRLNKGSSSSKLPPGVSFPPGEQVELVGNLGLPNKPACIYLHFVKKKEPLALFCYPQLAEGELFTGGLVGFESNAEQERLRDLAVLFSGQQACVSVGLADVLCKSLPYPIEEAKQRKKDAKKLLSVQKKVDSLQEKYDLWREKYATLSKNNKKREQGYLARNRVLRQDISAQKKQTTLFRNLYWVMQKKLGAAFAPWYQSPLANNMKFLYDTLAFSGDSFTLRVGPISFGKEEVEQRYDFYFAGVIPAQFIEQQEVKAYLTDELMQAKVLFSSLFENKSGRITEN